VLTVTASPIAIFGSGVYQATTNTSTASASGGTPPYSFSWQIYSGQLVGLNGAFTPTVSAQFGGGAGTYNTTLICTVTDSASNTGYVTITSTIILSL
jgi:hypothetical protein